jgi:hypothetical protein
MWQIDGKRPCEATPILHKGFKRSLILFDSFADGVVFGYISHKVIYYFMNLIITNFSFIKGKHLLPPFNSIIILIYLYYLEGELVF